MKSAMPALRRRRRAAYARSVGTQVVDEERADRRRRRRRQDTAILAKLTCHPRLRPPSSPSRRRRPPRYRHSSRAGAAAAADRRVGRRRALRIVMSCVPRAFVRLLARSLARSFKCFLTVHPLLAPSLLWMEGSDGASERAVHVEALADCTDWMEAGHPYGRLGWARGTSERKNKCSR